MCFVEFLYILDPAKLELWGQWKLWLLVVLMIPPPKVRNKRYSFIYEWFFWKLSCLPRDGMGWVDLSTKNYLLPVSWTGRNCWSNTLLISGWIMAVPWLNNIPTYRMPCWCSTLSDIRMAWRTIPMWFPCLISPNQRISSRGHSEEPSWIL